MKPTYALLFGLLAVTGCKKKDPRPDLKGRWEYVQTQTTYYHQTDGTVTNRSPALSPNPPGTHAVVITADSFNVSFKPISSIHTFVTKGTYTRDGDVLNIKETLSNGVVVDHQYFIDELTTNQLLFHVDRYFPANIGGALGTRENRVFKR